MCHNHLKAKFGIQKTAHRHLALILFYETHYFIWQKRIWSCCCFTFFLQVWLHVDMLHYSPAWVNFHSYPIIISHGADRWCTDPQRTLTNQKFHSWPNKVTNTKIKHWQHAGKKNKDTNYLIVNQSFLLKS